LSLSEKKNKLKTAEGEKVLGIGAKVKKLTWERLMTNKEIVHRWQEVCFFTIYYIMRC
jgi:ubiquinone biosynthesis protein COQ9